MTKLVKKTKEILTKPFKRKIIPLTHVTKECKKCGFYKLHWDNTNGKHEPILYCVREHEKGSYEGCSDYVEPSPFPPEWVMR